MATVERVLSETKLDEQHVGEVVLIGGSTHIPKIQQQVSDFFGGIDLNESINPDEVVALGAAIQGTLLHIKENRADLLEKNSFPLVEIKDVNSHSLGVVIFNEKTEKEENSIILKRNTPIPCKVSDRFVTLEDNQTKIKVQVTEGEKIDMKHVDSLGPPSWMKIPPYPKGSPLEVFFEYDHNGIIHVTVFDMMADKLIGEMNIQRKNNLNEEEIKSKQDKMRQINVN